jgi:transcriptional regulator
VGQGAPPAATRYRVLKPLVATDPDLTAQSEPRYTPLATREEAVVPKTEYLQGALDLLILKTLALGPNHGWGIQQRISQVSRETLTVSQGSLYPALHRLEAAGIVSSEMTTSDNNRKARVYQLTTAGRRRLQAETADWQHFSLAIRRLLDLA